MVSIIINLTLLMPFHVKFGQAYAYLKSNEYKKLDSFQKIWNFQKGIKLYNSYLGDMLDNFQIKHIDKIQSMIIVDKNGDSSINLQNFTEKFNEDKLAPMKYLCNICKEDPKTFLSKRPQYENAKNILEKISMIATLVVSTIFSFFGPNSK